MNLEEARDFFRNDVYATKTTGIELIEIGEGYSKCSLKIGPEHMNAAHSVMGGAIYTLADFSFAAATNAPDHLVVTATSEISYLSAPRTELLLSECRVVRDGKRSCFAETSICDSDGNPVARVTACGLHL